MKAKEARKAFIFIGIGGLIFDTEFDRECLVLRKEGGLMASPTTLTVRDELFERLSRALQSSCEDYVFEELVGAAEILFDRGAREAADKVLAHLGY